MIGRQLPFFSLIVPVLADLGVRRLARDAGGLAGDARRRRALRDAAVPRLQLPRAVARRRRRRHRLDGLPGAVPARLAPERPIWTEPPRDWSPQRTWPRTSADAPADVTLAATLTVMRAWMPVAHPDASSSSSGACRRSRLPGRRSRCAEFPVPALHKMVHEGAAGGRRAACRRPRSSRFNWLSATGTGILLAAIVAGLCMGYSPRRAGADVLAHARSWSASRC